MSATTRPKITNPINPTAKPIAAKTSPRRTTNPKTSRCCAQRHTQPDFKRTTHHHFRKRGVQTHGCKKQRRNREARQQLGFKTCVQRRLHEKFVERSYRKDRQISIAVRNRSAHRVQVRPWLTGNPQEYPLRPMGCLLVR